MKFIISSQNAGFTGAAPHCLQAPPAPASRGLSPQPRPKARGCGAHGAEGAVQAALPAKAAFFAKLS